MKKHFNIKWQNDLVNQISAYTAFAFEGNVNDLQPVLVGDKYQYLPMNECIAELLKEKFCVVYFDHTKRGVRQIQPKQPSSEEENKQEELDAPFKTFSFVEKYVVNDKGERIPNPNIELFKKFYTKEYAEQIRNDSDTSLQGDMTVDMRRILDAMKDYGEHVEVVTSEVETNGVKTKRVSYKPKNEEDTCYLNTKPFLFVLPEVSRFMTNPGSPSTPENSVLMTLFGATLLNNSPCRVILILDKMNDLPAWFEAEGSNPSMKKSYIPAPNAEFRDTYFDLELSSVMTNSENNQKGKDKYNAYTEKYSLRKLEQLKRYILSSNNDSDRDLNRIDKTIFSFEFGVNENPWLKPSTFTKIKDLSKEISKSISGQGHVIDQISTTLKSAVTGVNSSKSTDRKPKAVFFLAGPTGTGKTEMCRQLATILFGKEDKMIRFDMSEFREAHNESRLFGAPPGYVGYDAGGELTKAIKENPFSLLLFDEIEKANPKIWDKFLQILGDGRVTDGRGETVYFSESVIVFTSNLGITSTVNTEDPKVKAVYESSKLLLEEEYQKYESLTDDNEKKKSREEMEKLLTIIVDYEGISIKVKKEKYFEYMFKDDSEKLKRVHDYFSKFVKKVVKSRIAKYFDSISRREILGRIGDANIIVYNFIDEEIAVSIMENTINKFINYLLVDNVIPLRLTIPQETKNAMIEKIKKPEVLDLGGRGINMTTEKIISNAVGNYLYKIGEELVSKGDYLSTTEVHNGELIYDKERDYFSVKKV